MRASPPFLLLAGLLLLAPAPQEKPGYTDTPRLPGSRWRVHDAERPRPPLVSLLRSGVPSDAVVLFDGTGLEAFVSREGKPARWRVVEGAMEVNRTGDIRTKESFGSVQLHVEWRTPPVVEGSSQGRGNSGIYFMERYEVQVLDSFRNPTYADGQAAALYGQLPPLVNASRRPGEWQSYDIVFIAPRFEGEEVARPASVTVFHNGVCVQHDEAYRGPTSHRRLPRYRPHAPEAPIRFQDHGDAVRYRNIWLRRLPEARDR